MGRANGKSGELRGLVEENPDVASDLLALFGFDAEEALWLDQRPSAVRRVETLIARLAFHRGSLYAARRTKEASLKRKAQRASERAAAVAAGTDPDEFDKQAKAEEIKAANAQLAADPYEYFGHGREMNRAGEILDAINILQLTVVGALSGPDAERPRFTPAWRPGDEVALTDEHAGAVVIDDLDGFDPVALGLT